MALAVGGTLNTNTTQQHVYVISKVKAKLSSLSIICSLGQVKFSLDKCIMAMYIYVHVQNVLVPGQV